MSSGLALRKNSYTSKAWKFFKIKDYTAKLAECKLCQKRLSYRTSVSNLLKHAKKRHEIDYRMQDKSGDCEISVFSLSENEDDDCNDDDSEDNQTAKDLESLDTKNEEESVCLLCQETFQGPDSTEMMEHMLKVHNISQIKVVDGNIHLEQEESDATKDDRRKYSICWDYFTVKDNLSKMAQCNLCNQEFSFRSTVSNLLKHLKRKHKLALKNQSSNASREKVTNYKPRSALWSFYNYVNDEKTICACIYCDKEFTVTGGTSNMKKHLLDKHPEALLHHKTNSDPLFITNDDNNEKSDDDNLHEEYLDIDDLDSEDKATPKPSFERRSSFELRPKLERKHSFERKSSFLRRSMRPQNHRRPVIIQKKIPVVTQVKIPDSLEHFSNYTTSLLQELPEKISKKLQMNFVKQIIEAHISCAEGEICKEEIATTINSTVVGTETNNDVSMVVDESVSAEEAVVDKPVESVTASEGITTTSANSVNGDRVVTVANGIIIRPVVTTPQVV